MAGGRRLACACLASLAFVALALSGLLPASGGVAMSTTKKQVRLECRASSADGSALRRKPRTCTVQASNGILADLVRLRWTGPRWGSPSVRFKGRTDIPHERSFAVRGRVFRPRPDRCGTSVRLYTRVRFVWRVNGRASVMKLAPCSDGPYKR